MPLLHQGHLEIHGAAPDQIGCRPPGSHLLQMTAMQIRADAEHEIDLDAGMEFHKAAKQRLAIVALGCREKDETLPRHRINLIP